MIVSVPMTLAYLGPQRYGWWLTLSAAVFAFSFADLGIGNALINQVAHTNGKENQRAVHKVISTAAMLFSLIALTLLVGIAGLYALGVPTRLVGAARPRKAPKLPAVSRGLLMVFFALSIPLSLAPKVQTAFQEGYKANLWAAAGGAMGLLGIWLVIKLRGGMPMLALAFAGAPVAAAAANSLAYFAGDGRKFLPRFESVSKSHASVILRQGLSFLVIQIVVAVNVSSDNLLIAHFLGPEAVTAFGVPERLFGLTPILIHLALQPLWPAYADAFARDDHRWISATLKNSFLTALALSVLASLTLILAGGWIVRIWTAGAVAPWPELLRGLAVWKIIDSIEYAMTIFLAAAGALRPQMLCSFLAMLLALGCKIMLIPGHGVDWVPWISGLSRLSLSLTPYALVTCLILKRLR